VKLLLDEGRPFVSANNFASDAEEQYPLLYLANWAGFYSDRIHHNEKIYLLLKRGADVGIRDQWGRNCLHLVFLGVMHRLIYGDREEELKDILMSMVTAGADIDGYDNNGRSVPQLVCETGLERLWIEVLTECGHDADPFLYYFELYHLDNFYREKDAGYGAFATTTPDFRPTRLSFQEYGKQRKSLRCVLRAQNPEDYDFDEREELEEEIVDYFDSIGGDSDSEVEDVYSEEHGAEWWGFFKFVEDIYDDDRGLYSNRTEYREHTVCREDEYVAMGITETSIGDEDYYWEGQDISMQITETSLDDEDYYTMGRLSYKMG
jgi:hypothetical protein